MHRGEQEKEGKYHDFYEVVTRVQAEAEVIDIARIKKAGEESWQALAWIRERKNPARWGRKQVIEHTGKDGQPIQFEATMTKVIQVFVQANQLLTPAERIKAFAAGVQPIVDAVEGETRELVKRRSDRYISSD